MASTLGNSFFSLDERGASFGAATVIQTSQLQSTIFELPLLVQGVLYSPGETSEGKLIRSVYPVWHRLINLLIEDPNLTYQIDPRKWEELIATAFDEAGYDQVILTPRSGDFGRDVIAVKEGFGAIRIIGSVKALKPGRLVRHDDVRALLGVLSADSRASKGIVTTTTDFAPNIRTDPYIQPFLPYRLELVNGKNLIQWFERLLQSGKKR